MGNITHRLYDMKAIFITLSIVLFAFLSLVILGSCNIPSYDCQDEKDFKSQGYTYIIKSKFLDSADHGFRTLELYNKSGYNSFILVRDTSGFYEYVDAGDTISKKKNSNYLVVNGKRKFTIYFGCEK